MEGRWLGQAFFFFFKFPERLDVWEEKGLIQTF